MKAITFFERDRINVCSMCGNTFRGCACEFGCTDGEGRPARHFRSGKTKANFIRGMAAFKPSHTIDASAIVRKAFERGVGA